MLCGVYLPTFYVFKAAVFSPSWDPGAWAGTGLARYRENLSADACADFLSEECSVRVGVFGRAALNVM